MIKTQRLAPFLLSRKRANVFFLPVVVMVNDVELMIDVETVIVERTMTFAMNVVDKKWRFQERNGRRP